MNNQSSNWLQWVTWYRCEGDRVVVSVMATRRNAPHVAKTGDHAMATPTSPVMPLVPRRLVGAGHTSASFRCCEFLLLWLSPGSSLQTTRIFINAVAQQLHMTWKRQCVNIRLKINVRLLNAWTIIRIFQQQLWCLCHLFVGVNFFTDVKSPILRCENMSGITQCYLFQSLTNIFDLNQILSDNHCIFLYNWKKHPVSSSLQHTRAIVYLLGTHGNNCNINPNYKMVVRVTAYGYY